MEEIRKLWLWRLFPKEGLVAVGAVAMICVVMQRMGITCPILFLTGVSCPGCGMSRAWMSLIHLDLSAAVSYHPLFWIPAAVTVVFSVQKVISDRMKSVIALCMILLFLVVYGMRMLDKKDTIVVFCPKSGWIFQMISNIR